MKIVVPVDETLTLYKYNLHTAPKFAIYTIDNINHTIQFSLDSVVENPLYTFKDKTFPNNEINCNCDKEKQNNLMHKCEHYSLLETISDCTYLLANKYCMNTQNSMKKAGIKLYKIPPIINRIDMAIKNFLIGASIARTIQNTYYVS